MKASESEWSNQRQEDSISYKKLLPGKVITYTMEMIGILPRYNTTKCQLQSMSGTLLGTCRKMSATVQNKFQVSYLHVPQKMSATINKCPVSYLETYPVAGIHETVRY